MTTLTSDQTQQTYDNWLSSYRNRSKNQTYYNILQNYKSQMDSTWTSYVSYRDNTSALNTAEQNYDRAVSNLSYATQQVAEANKVLIAWQKELDKKLQAMNTAQYSYVDKKTATHVVWEEVVEVIQIPQMHQTSSTLLAYSEDFIGPIQPGVSGGGGEFQYVFGDTFAETLKNSNWDRELGIMLPEDEDGMTGPGSTVSYGGTALEYNSVVFQKMVDEYESMSSINYWEEIQVYLLGVGQGVGGVLIENVEETAYALSHPLESMGNVMRTFYEFSKAYGLSGDVLPVFLARAIFEMTYEEVLGSIAEIEVHPDRGGIVAGKLAANLLTAAFLVKGSGISVQSMAKVEKIRKLLERVMSAEGVALRYSTKYGIDITRVWHILFGDFDVLGNLKGGMHAPTAIREAIADGRLKGKIFDEYNTPINTVADFDALEPDKGVRAYKVETIRRDGSTGLVDKTSFPDGWSYEKMVEAGRKLTDDVASGKAQWLDPDRYRYLTKGRDNVFVTDFNDIKIIGYKNADGSLNSWFPLFGELR